MRRMRLSSSSSFSVTTSEEKYGPGFKPVGGGSTTLERLGERPSWMVKNERRRSRFEGSSTSRLRLQRGSASLRALPLPKLGLRSPWFSAGKNNLLLLFFSPTPKWINISQWRNFRSSRRIEIDSARNSPPDPKMR